MTNLRVSDDLARSVMVRRKTRAESLFPFGYGIIAITLLVYVAAIFVVVPLFL